MIKHILMIGLLSSLGVFAQPPSVVTNIVTAHPAFRIVNGQLYNTDLSTNFATLEGQCIKVLTNGVIVQRMEIQQTYQAISPDAAAPADANGGAPAQLVKEEYVPGKKFFLRNYPSEPLAAIGSPIVARAKREGVFTYESEVMESWDYGTSNRVAVVSINGVSTNLLKPGILKPGK